MKNRTLTNAAALDLAQNYLMEAVDSLRKFNEAEKAYGAIEAAYLRNPKYKSSAAARIAMANDNDLKSAGKKCEYYRDRANMLAAMHKSMMLHAEYRLEVEQN